MFNPFDDSFDRVNDSPENHNMYKYTVDKDTIIFKDGIIPQIRITNMVCSLVLNCRIDLLRIYSGLRFTEYNPTRFPGCIVRLLDPKATAIVFESGKVVILGVTSLDKAAVAAKKFISCFNTVGYDIKNFVFRLHNVVGLCDLAHPIYIHALYAKHCNFSKYEPDIFPALIYRLVKPRTVLLIFANGKVIITGAKSHADLAISLNNMYPVLQSYRKLAPPKSSNINGSVAEIKSSNTNDGVSSTKSSSTAVSTNDSSEEIKLSNINDNVSSTKSSKSDMSTNDSPEEIKLSNINDGVSSTKSPTDMCTNDSVEEIKLSNINDDVSSTKSPPGDLIEQN